jgi:CheY-like chemotaxis protein
VDPERRTGDERRNRHRRWHGRRRNKFDRRVGDRRGIAQTAFTREEMEKIRRAFSGAQEVAACPRCKGMLAVGPAVTRMNLKVREVRCSSCRRHVEFTECATARVLIIDPEQLVRSTLRSILTRVGHEVVEVPDGETGLQSFRETRADVVLVNMFLPLMDGNEFIRQCLKEFPTARIVAMSGRRRYGAPDPLSVAKEFGAVQVIRKPFTTFGMIRVVEEALVLS